MGGTTFYVTGEGASAEEAFAALVEQAQYEHGHGGYTGTIAEKDSFEFIPGEFETDDHAESYARQLIRDGDRRVDDKWGPAGALKLPGEGRWLFFGWASE